VCDDWLDRDALLALDLDPETVDAVLARWAHKGNGGRLCTEAEYLGERIALLQREQEGRGI
jgi:hypothetical protein